MDKAMIVRNANGESPAQMVNVKIYNQVYTIRTNDGDVERTERLAAQVDQRMREIGYGVLTADTLKVAILAALHIAAELDRANLRYAELNEELAARSGECAAELDQVLKGGK